MRLRDKAVIVTGGASGIGRAICELFAEEGARVLVADIDVDGGEVTLGRIKAGGGEAVFVQTDVSKEADVQEMVQAAVNAYGTVNVLVNDAAAFVFGAIEDVTREDWLRVMGVNVFGASSCVKHVVPLMKAAGGGSIVNIASISSFVAQPAFIPYSASKGALLQLTRCLALDLGPSNIRVNCICPGYVLTEATERHLKHTNTTREEYMKEARQASFFNRVGDPREVAYGALFLASDESSLVTGAPLMMDGGYTAA
jgi:NAD(P)-dependent dehydrogenase (short-subunit alcohol dehydrogenase family)